MRIARITLLLVAGSTLLTGCRDDLLTPTKHPAYDGGGYIGTGAKVDNSGGTATTNDSTQVSARGGGYIGTGA
jgi:hypothetical protein